MNAERWRQIETIFQGALQREPHERERFLDQACAHDQSLREQVRDLIRAHTSAAISLSKTDRRPVVIIGKTFGHYGIVEHIGAGGMGEVWKARDFKLRREVAVKMLPSHLTGDPERVRRIEREARALAALNHPRIATIYGLEDFEGTPALILEFIGQNWVSPTMNTTADGALYLTVLDVAKWDAALYTEQLLKKPTLDMMWTPVRLNNGSTHPYGFGWQITSVNGRRLIEHGGAWQGFKAHISRYVDDKLTVVVFANLAQANSAKMAHDVAAIYQPELK